MSKVDLKKSGEPLRNSILLTMLLMTINESFSNCQNNICIPPAVYVHDFQPLDNNKRFTSLPYISGDTFRSLANHIIDELRMPLDPNAIEDGDIIFLKTELLDYFFTTIHPRIKHSYILITHNSDFSSPGNYAHMLDEKKLIAWFAVNPDITSHKKLVGIPIGIANKYCPTIGNIETIDSLIPSLSSIKKNFSLYLSKLAQTNSERTQVENLFAKKSFCYKSPKKAWPEYLKDMARSKFVVSPHGNGLDCHRTWEALLMGSFPIVKTSTLDPLYTDLPVVIVSDWLEVTEEFLQKKYIELSQKKFRTEKMYATYWMNLIKNCQNNFLKKSK